MSRADRSAGAAGAADEVGARVRLGVAEARQRLAEAAGAIEAIERLRVEDAIDRILAAPAVAASSVPDYHASAMDGIAVRSRDVAAASAAAPIVLHAASGAAERGFQWVDTGNPLPGWADAVIMVEALEIAGDAPPATRPDAVRVSAAVEPWQHVRVVGEDVVAGERLLAAGQRLRPQDVGLLLAAGVLEVAVRARPVVAILPTGDELIEPGEARAPGRIVESNSRMIAAWVRAWEGEPLRLAPVGDDLDAIAERLREAAAAADVVCVLAGSSAGSRDYTARALARLGTVLAHGLDLVPGRPTILARLEAKGGGAAPRARVAIGIPGYPVAAAMVCRELLEPLVRGLAGASPAAAAAAVARSGSGASARARLGRAIETRSGSEELVRVDLGWIGDALVARPLARGAGALTSLSRAGGLVRLRPGAGSLDAGAEVDVELLDDLAAARATILASGYADPALDALESALAAADAPFRFALRSTSGAGALDDLRSGAAAAALLAAPGAGAPRLAEALAALAAGGLALRAFRIARRPRGWIVARGNPLAIGAVADAGRADVRGLPSLRRGGARARPPFAPGEDLSPRAADDEIPPLAVAVGVASGVADCGLGVEWAARCLGLDFAPLADEDVLLLVRADLVAGSLRAALAGVLGGDAYRAALAALPGYSATGAGELSTR